MSLSRRSCHIATCMRGPEARKRESALHTASRASDTRVSQVGEDADGGLEVTVGVEQHLQRGWEEMEVEMEEEMEGDGGGDG